MKKVALVFALAVFVPSLVLGWLAIRSLRDEQFLLERQHSILYQALAEAKAEQVRAALFNYQRAFSEQTTLLLSGQDIQQRARAFDELLRQQWPLAEVGFVVTTSGDILSPSPFSRPQARKFLADNSLFLANREAVEVYLSLKQAALYASTPASTPGAPGTAAAPPETSSGVDKQGAETKFRKVIPQQSFESPKLATKEEALAAASKFSAHEAEFRQLIGGDLEGTVARFVNNKLSVVLWRRPPRAAQYVFGAQLALPQLIDGLKPSITELDAAFREEVCLALLDDAAKPVALSRPGFVADWKRPFVATEIGETLPHWEVAVYPLDPLRLTRSARNISMTLGTLIGALLLVIGVGSWLIVVNLRRQLTLARQKTDFVSNVSHELKTPLTSIRMFTELLAEGRVVDREKQRSYLRIITAETARLSRLINNVLDFARLDRGEKQFCFRRSDIAAVVRDTIESYRPHLMANGFVVHCELPETPVLVNADRDALAQVVVNLLSNAEKYSRDRKEIEIRLEQHDGASPSIDVHVLDRGTGVPKGSEQRIFDQFYRAHDSLTNEVQGTGLGLTLARQIARAHGGDVLYSPRDGGGSCFTMRLPLATN